MPSNYPTALPGAPSIHGDVTNDILAIATELGVNPSDYHSTVKDRLDTNPPYKQLTSHYFPSLWTPGVALITADIRTYFTPFWVPETMTFDAVAVSVTTAVAASSLNVWLYGTTINVDHLSGVYDTYPGAGIASLGVIDTTVAGNRTQTFAQRQLSRGWYWLGGQCTLAPRFASNSVDARCPVRNVSAVAHNGGFVSLSAHTPGATPQAQLTEGQSIHYVLRTTATGGV